MIDKREKISNILKYHFLMHYAIKVTVYVIFSSDQNSNPNFIGKF